MSHMLLLLHNLSDNLDAVLLWALVATAVMTTVLQGSQGLGLSRLSLPFLFGTVVTADRRRAVLFGAFQRERYYDAARSRWAELALVARSAFAFAEFPDLDRPQVSGTGARPGPVLVPLPPEEPMARTALVEQFCS